MHSEIFPLFELNEAERNDPDIISKLQNDYLACMRAFTPDWNLILEKIGTTFSEQLEKIAVEEKWLEATKIVFFRQEIIFHQYQEAVLKPSYYLSDKELEFAAHLYKKRVVLFSNDQAPQVLNPAGTETVAIKHEGSLKSGHYSRLAHT